MVLSRIIPKFLREKVKSNFQKLLIVILSKVSGGINVVFKLVYKQMLISNYKPEYFLEAMRDLPVDNRDLMRFAFQKANFNANTILKSYLVGIFPTPDITNYDIIIWNDPEIRGINTLENIPLPKSLKPFLNQFEIRIDDNFIGNIGEYTKPRDSGMESWLSPQYIECLIELHKRGFAHCFEAYQNGILVGGEIGIAINGYYQGLTTFHKVNNAGFVILYSILVKLKNDGFKLFDCMWFNEWEKRFGLIKATPEEFEDLLLVALTTPVTFTNNVPQFL
jgi:leucyl/phenylalanyl-tRNA---protein transferase